MADRNRLIKRISRKTVATAVLVPSFYFLEWALVAATASVFALFKYHGLSDGTIWLILWGGNLTVSGLVILANDRLGVDLTLMQSLRNLITATTQKTKWFGWILEAALFFRLLIWDGPCQLLIFFRERLSSRPIRILFFIFSSGFQMFVWAKLYSLGYEGIADLVKEWR